MSNVVPTLRMNAMCVDLEQRSKAENKRSYSLDFIRITGVIVIQNPLI